MNKRPNLALLTFTATLSLAFAGCSTMQSSTLNSEPMPAATSLTTQEDVARLRYAELVAEAQNLLASMSGAQRDAILYPIDAPGRTMGFCYVLNHCPDDHQGLRLQDLSGTQKIQLNEFLMKALSGAGYAKAIQTLNREWILEESENAHRAMPEKYPVVSDVNAAPWIPPLKRGAPRYYLALFGEPSTRTPWGMRFEGHHLSINLTFSAEDAVPQVAITPMFFGSSPMIIPPAPEDKNSNYTNWQQQEGQQLLAREAWLAKSFIRALDTATLNKGKWHHLPGPALDGGTDQVLTSDHNAKNSTQGIERKDLSPTENALLLEFIEELMSNHTDHHRLQLKPAEFQKTKVWWYGNPNDDHAEFYLRVRAGDFLIEFLQSNTYGVTSEVAANHVHASVRNPKDDWGYNPLEAHIKEHHH